MSEKLVRLAVKYARASDALQAAKRVFQGACDDVLMGLLVAKLFANYGKALDASMRAQCRADQSMAASASALIAIAETHPDLADQIDDSIAHLVDMTGGRTPQQIAALPQCRDDSTNRGR